MCTRYKLKKGQCIQEDIKSMIRGTKCTITYIHFNHHRQKTIQVHIVSLLTNPYTQIGDVI